MMEQKKNLPLIADAILKVKRQEITFDEERVSFINVEGLPEDEALLIIRKWFNEYGSIINPTIYRL